MNEQGLAEVKERDLGMWRAVEVGRVDEQRMMIGEFIDVNGELIRLPLMIAGEELPECVRELGYKGMAVGKLDGGERKALGEALEVLPYPLAVHAVCNMGIKDFSGLGAKVAPVVVLEGPPQSGKTILAITEKLTTPPSELCIIGFDPFSPETLEETMDRLGELPYALKMHDTIETVLRVYGRRRAESEKVNRAVSLSEDLSMLVRKYVSNPSGAYLLDIPGRDFRTKDYGFSVYHLLSEMFPGIHLLEIMAKEPGHYGALLERVKRGGDDPGWDEGRWKGALGSGDWRELREMVDMVSVPLSLETSRIEDRGTAYILGLRRRLQPATLAAKREFWENQERWRGAVVI